MAVVIGATKTTCDHVAVWTPSSRSFTAFGPHRGANCGGKPGSLAEGVTAVALAGTRAAWIEYATGNHLDLSIETASLAAPAPQLVAYAENGSGAEDDPAGPYLGNLAGHGSLLVFDAWTHCADPGDEAALQLAKACVAGQSPLYGIRLERVAGTRAAVLGTAARLKDVVATDGTRIVVRRDDGPVDVVATDARALVSVPFAAGSVQTARLDGDRLVVLADGRLSTYTLAGGARLRSWNVPAGARLLDAGDGRALLLVRGALQIRPLDGGAAATVRAPGGAGIVDASLGADGVYYAYNVAGPGSLGRVAFLQQE